MASESGIRKQSSGYDDRRKQSWSYWAKSGRRLFDMVEKRRKTTESSALALPRVPAFAVKVVDRALLMASNTGAVTVGME